MTEVLDLHGQDSDGSSEEVVLTPAELIERLEQEENLRRAKRGDLKVSIHQMEMERIRYVLSSYLRCRLMKIEKFFPHILEKEKTRPSGEPSILSPEELVFVREYMDHTETHFRNVALKHMPPNLQKVDLLRAVPKPDLDSYVFLRVKERQENILVEPEADEQRSYNKNPEPDIGVNAERSETKEQATAMSHLTNSTNPLDLNSSESSAKKAL
ncbi:hypothetical protein STEG23_007130 [Scotinomys teguina]